MEGDFVLEFDDPLPNVEQPEEDPLGGTVSPSEEDGTVPRSQGTVPGVPDTSGQKAPGITPAVKLVNLDDLLQNPTRKQPQSTSHNRECDPSISKSLNITAQEKHNSSKIEDEPEEICISDPVDPQMNKYTEQSGIINTPMPAQNTPNPMNSSAGCSPVSWPTSVPSGDLVNIPLNFLRGGAPNINVSLCSTQTSHRYPPTTPNITFMSVRQITPVPRAASSDTIKQVAVPTSSSPSLLPGTNMVVVRTRDGRLLATPITSLTTPITSLTTPVTSMSPVASLPHPIYSTSPNTPTSVASNKTCTSTPTVNMSHSRPSRQRKIEVDPMKYIRPLRWRVDPNKKPTWPPTLTKKKLKPKVILPLSGSWTNPNPPSSDPQLTLSASCTIPSAPAVQQGTQKNDNHSIALPHPERDPLDGPVKPIIQYPKQTDRNKGSIITDSSFTLKELPTAKHEQSTQCFLFPITTAPLRESASKTDLFTRPPLKMNPARRGVGLGIQAKCIAYNVYKYLEQRNKCYNLFYSVTEMTSNATGIKVSSVKRIMMEANKTSNKDDPNGLPTFKAPSASRDRVKIVISNMHVDTALRRYIHEHFLEKQQAPGVRYMQSRCHSDGLAAGKSTKNFNFFRLRVKKLGFVTVRTQRRLIHVEGPPIRAWRYRYLHQLSVGVEEKKNVVFTFAVNLRGLGQSEANWEVLESFDGLGEKSRVLTVFNAADENGFIAGSFLMNDTVMKRLKGAKSYFEWLELNVLRKIPEGSVVVLAHEKYHEMVDSEWKPNAGSSKKEIVDWLKSHMVGDFDATLPKCVLLEKVSKFPLEQKYSVDSLVETYGHIPVHLPPSQRDLNPLEYVWEDIRSKFSVRGKLKIAINSLAHEFSSLDHRLKKAWEQVRGCEETYRKNDPFLDGAQEAAIRKLGGLWTCPTAGALPDGTSDDMDVDLESSNSDSSDSNSDSSSKSASGSNSDPEIDSDSESESSSDSELNESSSSASENCEDVPPSESVSGTKRRKL